MILINWTFDCDQPLYLSDTGKYLFSIKNNINSQQWDS